MTDLFDAFVDVVDCIPDVGSVGWILLERRSRLLEVEGGLVLKPEHISV